MMATLCLINSDVEALSTDTVTTTTFVMQIMERDAFSQRRQLPLLTEQFHWEPLCIARQCSRWLVKVNQKSKPVKQQKLTKQLN